MTPEERLLCGQNELFRDIDIGSIDYILDDCLVLPLSSGEKLLEIGQKNSSLYLVLEGELHVYMDNRDLTEHAVLKGGQCVGELSLIDGGNVSALVIAAADTRVVAIPHHHMWALVDSLNGVARNLLSILAGRIRNKDLLRVTTSERSLVFDVASNVDALTGLHNRNWMEDSFPRMMMRCERSRMPLCMLMVDIDGFKAFNQNYGRLAGDGLLKMTAKLLAENLRPQDLLVYLGSDKFAVQLPDTEQNGAMKISERLRAAMADAVLHTSLGDSGRASRNSPMNQDTRVTISLGVSAMQPGDSLDMVLSMSHMALYQAKAAGGNQARLADSVK